MKKDSNKARMEMLCLRHPKIMGSSSFVRLYDSPADSSCLYFCLTLCEYTLETYINQEKTESLQKKIPHIFKQLVQAVQILHDAGFAHRDLHPSNILFDTEGKLLLADFDESLSFKDNLYNEELSQGRGKTKKKMTNDYDETLAFQVHTCNDNLSNRNDDSKENLINDFDESSSFQHKGNQSESRSKAKDELINNFDKRLSFQDCPCNEKLAEGTGKAEEKLSNDFDKSSSFEDRPCEDNQSEGRAETKEKLIKADIQAIENLLCYIATGGKYSYKTEKTEFHKIDGLLKEHIHAEVRDLIKKLDDQKGQSLSLKEVLQHPFFWSQRSKYTFLRDIGELNDIIRKNKQSEIVKNLNEKGANPSSSFHKWIKKVMICPVSQLHENYGI
nr:PREDICTED: uncharacterized protein LOC102349980 [Latimeria chalumnae]|eukprot:XP_006014108.1 PREDICTED: uncharacterized protein LOC102349980 [Latimeria chalumnae]